MYSTELYVTTLMRTIRLAHGESTGVGLGSPESAHSRPGPCTNPSARLRIAEVRLRPPDPYPLIEVDRYPIGVQIRPTSN
jgi:hypothetical protein